MSASSRSLYTDRRSCARTRRSLSASVSAFLRASVNPNDGAVISRSIALVRADRLVDDPVRLDLERQHVAAVLGTSRRLAVVQRPLVEREDRLLGLGLDLGAELHPLGEDDLLLGGEQRHAADLTQVQANGVVGVEDLGGLRLGLLGVGLGGLRGRCRLGRLGGDLGSHGLEGLRRQVGDLGIELDRGGREGGLSLGHGRFGLGDRGSRRVEGNHVAPADEVAPSRATSG